jgi:ferrous iron transport protein B
MTTETLMQKIKWDNPNKGTAVVAVAGNPNSGKTTLFNGLTGGKQRIGNWPGVTVEKKEGVVSTEQHAVRLVDLPGIYSLSASSEDEIVARDYLLGGEPEIVINIVDATNLERNLYLTTQLIEMKVPVFVVLNMMDLVDKRGLSLDVEHLERHLGVPVVAITATEKKDIQRIKEKLDDAIRDKAVSNVKVTYPNEIESVITQWSPRLERISRGLGANPRWISTKLLEGDPWITKKIVEADILSEEELTEAAAQIETLLEDEPDVLLADYRYGFIHGLVKDVVKKKRDRKMVSDIIDKVMMNRILGIPIFLGIMYLMFWVTISVGGAFIDFFDILFGAVFVDGFAALLGSIGSPEWLITLLAHGIGAGIQTVSTFVPIIFMMFFMLSILEDSGYMARAAFVMDRFMRMIGLPGKSFVPMLVGFGCTVPAIMATRTLENKKDRYMTVFMVPFMSCGARLPVYALFGAAFFGAAAGSVVFSIYMVGIVLAVLTGLLLKNTLFQGEPSHFIMELPPYHLPRFRHIMFHTWNRLKVFMIRAGLVITIVVTVLGFLNSIGTDGSIGNEDTDSSVLSVIGKAITPVFEPMGVEEDNWPASVAVFTGLFAKEAVVGTLSSLYSQMDAAEAGGAETATDADAAPAETGGPGFSLGAEVVNALRSIPEGLAGIGGGLSDPLGAGIIAEGDQESVAEEVEAEPGVFAAMRARFPAGGAGAYAYLLFILIYFPCVAALGAAVREIGAGFGWLAVGYLTLLGWITATLFYQITVAHQIIWIIVPLALLGGIYLLFRVLGKEIRARRVL